MPDSVTLIGVIFGVLAILYGLISRNFRTAVVAGLLVGLIHAGLVALLVARSGSAVAAELPFSRKLVDLIMQARDVPFVKDGIDLAMNSPYFATPLPRLAAYLLAGALTLMLTLVVLYVVKRVFAGLVSIVTPKKA